MVAARAVDEVGAGAAGQPLAAAGRRWSPLRRNGTADSTVAAGAVDEALALRQADIE